MSFNEIIKKAKNIRMKPEEKSALRAHLYAVAKGEEVQSEKWKVKSLGFWFLKPMPIFTSFMIALLAGGGVSFASENALPGDMLYPIKVNINEEILSKITLSDEAKADWEVRRAERRLEEAEKLFDSGRLDKKNKAIVKAQLEKHAEKATQRSEAANDFKMAKVEAKAQTKLELVLQKHGRILDRLAEEAKSLPTQVKRTQKNPRVL